jgi:hypothetical protein
MDAITTGLYRKGIRLNNSSQTTNRVKKKRSGKYDSTTRIQRLFNQNPTLFGQTNHIAGIEQRIIESERCEKLRIE